MGGSSRPAEATEAGNDGRPAEVATSSNGGRQQANIGGSSW